MNDLIKKSLNERFESMKIILDLELQAKVSEEIKLVFPSYANLEPLNLASPEESV